MNRNDFELKMVDYRKGTYIKVKYVSYGKAETKKIVESVVRIVDYAKLVGKTPSTTPYQPRFTKISEYVFQTSKSEITYFFTSKSPKHHSKVRYFNGETEITKAEYEMVNPPRPSLSDSGIFSKRISDILEIGA